MTRGLPAFFIVWPERRWVAAETIATWYADAVADRQVGPGVVGGLDYEAMARALDDAGIITTGRAP